MKNGLLKELYAQSWPAKKDKTLFGGHTKNYNQNHKIAQMTSKTLIIGN